ncbi:MAG: protein kinase [Chloroflexi bacterium]|uniref:protein kinase domain-containing protein n=1 Tax=Candidatus Flexifilum breve TaxID=3140694 RepID=UPI00313548F1|nr:protein kinase [Chloroflexota bacterium]
MPNETVLNGRYRLVAQHGSGGMSVIYKAIDQALGRTVAIKILRPSLTNDPAFLARFRNEARSVANLAHENIVTIFDVGSDGLTHYIVMEFVEGNDLKRIIKTDGALPIERVLKLGIQICAGIGFSHRSGLVHADVKPQNILITRNDTVKVLDFGIAQAFTDTQPHGKQTAVWGSPHYFAPEQAQGETPTPASDVYSIGIVLFEMLTGRLPYSGSNQQELGLAHIRSTIPLLSEIDPNLPEDLTKIVHKVMSKEPKARYWTADQLGQVLRSYRDRETQPAIISSVRSMPPPPLGMRVPPQPPKDNLLALEFFDLYGQKPHPPTKIFISYKSEDRPLVEGLAGMLSSFGHDVWYDKKLKGGQDWWDEICRNIRERSIMLTAVSPSYLTSKACRLEYEYAYALRRRVLPLEIRVLGSDVRKLPVQLQRKQVVRWLRGDSAELVALNDAFGNLETEQSLPDPLPMQPEAPISELSKVNDVVDLGAIGDLTYQMGLIGVLRVHLASTRADDQAFAREILSKLQHQADLKLPVAREIEALVAAYDRKSSNFLKRIFKRNDR